jgi:hypothetical protein
MAADIFASAVISRELQPKVSIYLLVPGPAVSDQVPSGYEVPPRFP